MTDDPPTLTALLGRYGHAPRLALPPVASLSWGGKQLRLLENLLHYLRSFGKRVTTLDELQAAIEDLHDEEELGAHRVREGVAVSHASSGEWLLVIA